MQQRVASYSSDLSMLPVVSLITYTCKARVSDFFCNKDIAAASPKKNLAVYSNAHFNGEDGSPKTWNPE